MERCWALGVLASFAFGVPACSLLTATDDLSGDDVRDASVAEAAHGADAGDDADAGSEAGPATTCSPGALVAAVEVFDPYAGGDAGSQPACRVQSALVADGVAAGLDHDGSDYVLLVGQGVTACVAARFSGALTNAIVRLRSIANACGSACYDVACATGRIAHTFAGPNFETVHFVGTVELTDEFADYSVATQSPDRVIVVCRTTQGPGRDDVEVDAFTGRCR